MRLASSAQWWMSVRARLVAYALLCAVPLLLLTALQVRSDSQHLRHHAAESAQLLTERMAGRTSQVLASAESLAQVLGALDLEPGESGSRCSAALSRALAAAGPGLQNFTLASPSGQLLCSARPTNLVANIADRPHFQQALQLRRPVLSGLAFGRVLGRHALLLAVPLLGDDGTVMAVATAAIDPEPLGQPAAVPHDVPVVLAVFDRDGLLVSRSPPAPGLATGTDVRQSEVVRFALRQGHGEADLTGLDGQRRHYVTRAILYRGEPVLWVAAGLDLETLEAQAQSARWRELGWVLLVAAAVVAVAVTATRPVVLARVRNLLDVAAQVSQGRHGSRVPVVVQDDLTPVETALNRMLDAVEADRAVLEASENRYRMLFEHSLDGVLQLDDQGTVVAANPAACRMLGRTEAQLKGLPRARLVDPADGRLQELLRRREELGQARGELRMLRADGSAVEVAVATSLYSDGTGRQQTCIVMHDVTEQKAMQHRVLRLNRELEMRVAQRTYQLQVANRELEAFAYSVSHDLRAPVAVVRSFAEVLDESGAVQGDKHRHYLQRIRAAGLHMNELIDGLLALAQISRSQLEWTVVDLSALARETAQELASLHARDVQVDIAPGMHAMGDMRLLRVVLYNLLGNAFKFSSRQPAPRVSMEVAPSSMGEQVFVVRDNGEGFDPGQAHRLFVAFQRLHRADEYPGVGIGLATVQRIVQRHGGRIWAESRPGGGAAFHFVLGSADAPPPAAAQAPGTGAGVGTPG